MRVEEAVIDGVGEGRRGKVDGEKAEREDGWLVHG
jgi:hypothetical protein